MKSTNKKQNTHYILKVIISSAEKVAIAILTLLAGTLAFPFSFWNFMPMLLFFFLAIIGIVVVKTKKLTRFQKQGCMLFVIFCILTSILWGTLSPLIASDSITYILVLPEKKPFEAKLIKVSLPEQNIGIKIVALSDPLRPYLLNFLRKFKLFACQVIDVQKVADDFYLVPPLQTCLIHTELTASATSLRVSQLLRFIDFSPDLDLQVKKDNSHVYRTGFSLKSGNSISRTYNINSTTPLWHAVNCGREITQASIVYTALFDYALTAASLAKTEEAFSAMYEAGQVVPSDVERARFTSLLAHWSLMRLGGTLGGLQSVSYYREAADALVVALRRQTQEYSDHDRLVLTSVYSKLLSRMGRDADLFSRELKEFDVSFKKVEKWDLDFSNNDDAINAIKKTMANLFWHGFYDDYIAKVIRMDIKELQAESIKASKNQSNSRLFIEAALPSFFSYVFDANKSELYFGCLDRALLAAGNPWQDSYAPILQVLRYLPTVAGKPVLKSNSLFVFDSEVLNLLHLPLLAKSVPDMNSGNWQPSFIPDPPDSAWWTNKNIDWFLLNLSTATLGKKTAVSKTLSIYSLVRDHAGRGRLFMPGLAFAYYVANRSGNKGKDVALEFEREFSSNIGMSPSEYFNKIRWSHIPAKYGGK